MSRRHRGPLCTRIRTTFRSRERRSVIRHG